MKLWSSKRRQEGQAIHEPLSGGRNKKKGLLRQGSAAKVGGDILFLNVDIERTQQSPSRSQRALPAAGLLLVSAAQRNVPKASDGTIHTIPSMLRAPDRQIVMISRILRLGGWAQALDAISTFRVGYRVPISLLVPRCPPSLGRSWGTNKTECFSSGLRKAHKGARPKLGPWLGAACAEMLMGRHAPPLRMGLLGTLVSRSELVARQRTRTAGAARLGLSWEP